jgi:predicted nucleic acid-binding protein
LIGSNHPPAVPDIVRLEILAGITPLERQRAVRRDLDAFASLKLSTTDHDLAAEFFSLCVSKGIQAGLVDLLLCATAIRRKMPIFTQDRDFLHYSKHLPVKLHRTDLTFP